MIPSWNRWLLENEARSNVKLYDVKLVTLYDLMKIPPSIKKGIEEDVLDAKGSSLVDSYDTEEMTDKFLKDCRNLVKYSNIPAKELYVVYFGWPSEEGYKMELNTGSFNEDPDRLVLNDNRYAFWYSIVSNSSYREINSRRESYYYKPNINPQLHFISYNPPGSWVDEKVLMMRKETLEIFEALSELPIKKVNELIKTELKKPIDIQKFKTTYRGTIMGSKFNL